MKMDKAKANLKRRMLRLTSGGILLAGKGAGGTLEEIISDQQAKTAHGRVKFTSGFVFIPLPRMWEWRSIVYFEASVPLDDLTIKFKVPGG